MREGHTSKRAPDGYMTQIEVANGLGVRHEEVVALVKARKLPTELFTDSRGRHRYVSVAEFERLRDLMGR